MRLPLRVRLTLGIAVGMTLVLAILGGFVYLRLKADLVDSVDLGLRARAQALTSALTVADARGLVDAEGKLIDPDEAFAQVLDRTGRIEEASPGVADAPLLTAAEAASVYGSLFITRRPPGFDDPIRLLAVPVVRPTGPAVVVVGATLGDLNDALGQLAVILLTAGPLTLLLVAGAGWLLAGAALRPVERMRREAAAISASEPARRLPDPGTGDELGRLATTLNSMLDRLQESLERERRFVDDASHELRTPLATLRAEIDLALAHERTAADLETALRSAQDDVVRLQRLADDLLVLARSRGGRIPVRRVETWVADVIRRSVNAVLPEAATAGVTISIVNGGQPVPAELDPDRVEQAVRNLLENAIRHTPAGGTIQVAAKRIEGGIVRITVEDSGPGFPPDLLTSAFDPFVRRSALEDREAADGTGLGLAIVRAVAQAHGGSARAENLAGGARVVLDLRG